MTDIQGLRAQLRDTRPTTRSSSSSSGGGGGIPFWAIAAGAAALGFAIVLFTPRFYTMQRTAALPDVQSAQRPPEPADSAHAAAPQAVAPQAVAPHAPAPEGPATASRYAGKAPEEVVRTVEVVCDERARVLRGASSGTSGPKAADEKLHCFLTEAPARFCAPNLKRKATADVINYFKGIEYTNKAIIVAAKLKGTAADGMLGAATIDPRVVEAVEGLMRAGYLTKAHRDEIAANVPADVKDRFARVIGSTPTCPKPPWWASLF
jgi:hypothetical protein